MSDFEPPPFTAALDARVPAENIILSHYMASLNQWVCASESSDGRVFIGRAKTEPLARRAAGLRTFSHLEDRVAGKTGEADPAQIDAARNELDQQLAELEKLVARYNGSFPLKIPQEAVVFQVRSAREVLKSDADRPLLARWIIPSLIFIAGAFAEGAIGAFAEQAIDALTEFLKT